MKETKQQLTRKKTSAPRVVKSAARSAAPEITHDDIARRAYELFQARGGLHGFHLEDWLTAEAELRR